MGIMKFAKRIFLFLLVNILVVTTISIAMNLLGVQPYLNARGIDYQSLAVFCLIWGMAGSLISLALSRVMAKFMMGVEVIPSDTSDPGARELLSLVTRLASQAGLSKTPQVGVYESPEVNAFATGPTESRSLVAVSRGLLSTMNRTELEGVLAHEISHIANGDMVTMTLIQGIVNAFTMFLARVISFFISQQVDEKQRYFVRFLTTIILDIVFSLLGSMVVAYFSRWREYRADAGSARLVGREPMIAALQRLQLVYNSGAPVESRGVPSSMKITGKGMMAFLATHPPLEDRIAALRSARAI